MLLLIHSISLPFFHLRELFDGELWKNELRCGHHKWHFTQWNSTGNLMRMASKSKAGLKNEWQSPSQGERDTYREKDIWATTPISQWTFFTFLSTVHVSSLTFTLTHYSPIKLDYKAPFYTLLLQFLNIQKFVNIKQLIWTRMLLSLQVHINGRQFQSRIKWGVSDFWECVYMCVYRQGCPLITAVGRIMCEWRIRVKVRRQPWVSSQVPSTFLFETGYHTKLKLCQVG